MFYIELETKVTLGLKSHLALLLAKAEDQTFTGILISFREETSGNLAHLKVVKIGNRTWNHNFSPGEVPLQHQDHGTVRILQFCRTCKCHMDDLWILQANQRRYLLSMLSISSLILLFSSSIFATSST